MRRSATTAVITGTHTSIYCKKEKSSVPFLETRRGKSNAGPRPVAPRSNAGNDENACESSPWLKCTYAYLTRIIPALSLFGVIVLLCYALPVSSSSLNEDRVKVKAPAIPQLFLAAYILVLHLLSIIFPARLCWALGNVLHRMREEAPGAEVFQLISPDRQKRIITETASPPVIFAIIVPAYREHDDTLVQTLRVLASHRFARTSYDVYLAMELRDSSAEIQARSLVTVFGKSFRRCLYTLHPAGIPGEAPGKSSNEAWAFRQALAEYSDTIKDRVVVTIMDADTHLSQRYFDRIIHHHITNTTSRGETLYVPPIVFDRNLHEVPLPVRVADIAWAGAGLSSLYSGSSVCIPTSVYSLPMTLVERVGGWDTGPAAIGEDMHMYLKCFFALSGHLNVKVVYAAASSYNVCGDKHGTEGYCINLLARYRQALRHMWGCLDTGYAVRKTIEMHNYHLKLGDQWISKPVSCAAAVQHILRLSTTGLGMFCFPDWPAAGLMTWSRKSSKTKHIKHQNLSENRYLHLFNLLTLFHRLFEAHFLPIHLFAILAATTVYTNLCSLNTLSSPLQLALHLSSYLRLAGWFLMAIFFGRYNKYHKLCVELRENEMRTANMLHELKEQDSITPYASRSCGVLEAIVFPFAGVLFGALPHCHAILAHLFTEKLTYCVSLKPRFDRVASGNPRG